MPVIRQSTNPARAKAYQGPQSEVVSLPAVQRWDVMICKSPSGLPGPSGCSVAGGVSVDQAVLAREVGERVVQAHQEVAFLACSGCGTDNTVPAKATNLG